MTRIFALVLVTSVLLVGTANAATDTRTTTRLRPCHHYNHANVCDTENFGGYDFYGRVFGSERGQRVKLQWKRSGADRWRPMFPFDPDEGQDKLGFWIIEQDDNIVHVDRDGRWGAFITPYVRPGRYRLRALFPKQGDQRWSASNLGVYVHASE